MHSESQDKVDTSIQNAMASVSHENFKNRLLKYLDRKEEWILHHRRDIITRNNNTNNYAEASIRIIKDIVLGRTKAFNVVALVEFCVNVFEKYLCSRLLEFANNRRVTPFHVYEGLLRKLNDYPTEKIVKMGDDVYHVPSSSDQLKVYSVNTKIGTCECPSGISGGFCKHQALLHQVFNTSPINLPSLNLEIRFSLAKLALGENCPSRSFYSSFLVQTTDGSAEMETDQIEVAQKKIISWLLGRSTKKNPW